MKFTAKVNTVETLQDYLNNAKVCYDAGCVGAYEMFLSQFIDALKWYTRFTGKKYTVKDWKVVEA